ELVDWAVVSILCVLTLIVMVAPWSDVGPRCSGQDKASELLLASSLARANPRGTAAPPCQTKIEKRMRKANTSSTVFTGSHTSNTSSSFEQHGELLMGYN
ncbi:unnamed protein product, partial [Meganyctiphanes norvegica]